MERCCAPWVAAPRAPSVNTRGAARRRAYRGHMPRYCVDDQAVRGLQLQPSSQRLFGHGTYCFGSCPYGWQTLTIGVHPWVPIAIDASPADPYTSSPNFGKTCSTAPCYGKVLCALGGRPASAQCTYTWRGTAPDCLDSCEPGETLLAKDTYGDSNNGCVSGTHNKMFCERCQTELYNLNDCTAPTWYGTAPTCQGECNVGDRVMARATKESDVPADQDPGGFGKKCLNDGWKVRCHQCKLRNLLGGGPRIPPYSNTTCSKPKAGIMWRGTPYITLPDVKSYDRCCRECYDLPECRRFHVGPTGCFLFPTASGALAAAPKRHGRAGGGVWQAGSRRV
ncbi:serpin B isoform B [Chlorella sorokiniana]|uniref:Serpin B isoform B n=1 Tax=Chlorella sorokiniana TaxID=3076 RepID=A0A2P6TN69_CHLSO|nr:serpin B isoform B [Chlorella sorokiniana]|eukprot:PRW50768.1 serpin B isoform B [Chlorella sorokiniana]